MDILFILLGIAVGALCGVLYARNGSAGQAAKARMLQENFDRADAEARQLRDQTRQLGIDLAAARTAKEAAETQLYEARQEFVRQKDEISRQHNRQLDELRQQQKEQMDSQAQLIREQINTVSENILKKRAEELNVSNKQQLDLLLNPLHESLKQMRQSVEQSNKDRLTSMENLRATIKASQQQAEAAVRTDNPWYLPSGNMSFMTFLPFLIVFVAAFITFTLRNLSKKDGVAKPGSREQGKAATRKAAGREQQDKLLRTVQPVTAQKEEKSKGRHFEMRI